MYSWRTLSLLIIPRLSNHCKYYPTFTFIPQLHITLMLYSPERERERERKTVRERIQDQGENFQVKLYVCLYIHIASWLVFPFRHSIAFLCTFSQLLKYQPLSHTTIVQPEQRISNEHCYCTSILRKNLRYAFFIKLNVPLLLTIHCKLSHKWW